MLNFGYWPATVEHLFDAQQRFVHEIWETLPDREKLHSGLEIGCGIGGICINLLRNTRTLSMTGLDISPQQLALAQQNAASAGVGSRLALRKGSSMDLPFDDHAFDFTLCIESTFHYEDKASFFAENFRVLVPGGYAVVADITCEDAEKVKYRRGNHFEARQSYIDCAQGAGFVVESVKDLGPYVYRPLHAWITSFNRRQRVPSGKYWSVVLHNYEQLASLGLMGYHLFLLHKPSTAP
jgi:ubiquinone/menaquinone biosynthesis C-methylase UbiE